MGIFDEIYTDNRNRIEEIRKGALETANRCDFVALSRMMGIEDSRHNDVIDEMVEMAVSEELVRDRDFTDYLMRLKYEHDGFVADLNDVLLRSCACRFKELRPIRGIPR